ncbi:hypothetical protein L0F63_001865, partial [Massospora cicadina]
WMITARHPELKTKMLIDTDPGIDDVMAILLSLSTPTVEVCSITLTHGNTTLANVTRNIFSIFHVLDCQFKSTGIERFAFSKPRIALGYQHPIKGNLFTAEFFHGWDGMGNVSQTHPHLMDPHWESRVSSRILHPRYGDRQLNHPRYEVSQLDAVNEIIHQLNKHPPNTLIILALGPLTNIALAIERDHKAMQRAKEIVIMGGAVFTMGNVTPKAEFNFYADAHAANVVFESATKFSLPLTLVPLDITHTTFLHRDLATAHFDKTHQPLAELLFNMLTNSFEVTKESYGIDGVALHDPLAAAIALGLVRPAIQKMRIEIECNSVQNLGACITDLNSVSLPLQLGHYVNVCMTLPEPDSFQALLLKALFPNEKL